MLTLVSNPKRRTRKATKRRHRRNPDGTFIGTGTGTGVSANPKRRTSRKRRHNPGTALAANPASNPARHRRRRRHNPFGLEKVTEHAWGVSPGQIGMGIFGFVGTEMIGGHIDKLINPQPPAGTVPNADGSIVGPDGTIYRPADDKVDLLYAVRKAFPRGLAAFILYFGGRAVGLKRPELEALGVAGAASTGGQFIGATHVAPDILTDGSLVIGHKALPAPSPMRLLPPPPPMSDRALNPNGAPVVVRGVGG